MQGTKQYGQTKETIEQGQILVTHVCTWANQLILQ